MMMGIFHPPVSRLTVAMVERHWGANTNQANKDNAVAKLHVEEIKGTRALAASAPVLDKA